MTWRTLLLIIVLVPLEIILSVMINSPRDLHTAIQNERQTISEWIGRDGAVEIVNVSNARYMSLFVDTGVQQAVHRMFIPDSPGVVPVDDLDKRGEKMFQRVESNLLVLWAGIYYAIQRLTLFLSWLPYFLPLVIPAIVNGYMNREIKKVSYGYASQWKYEVSFKLLSILIVSPFLYLFFPGAISPIVIPVWAIGLTLTALLLFSNLQKQL